MIAPKGIIERIEFLSVKLLLVLSLEEANGRLRYFLKKAPISSQVSFTALK